MQSTHHIDSVSAHDHILLLSTNGDVLSFGSNKHFQIQSTCDHQFQTPVQIPLHNAIRISAGDCHSLVLLKNGDLFGWGYNDDEQILPFSHDLYLDISKIDLPYKLLDIHAGHYYSYGLTDEGKIITWGRWRYGFQESGKLSNICLMNGYLDRLIVIDANSSVFTLINNKVVSHSIKAKSVAAGKRHFIAVDLNGLVWGWGENYKGQLGICSDVSKKPMQVPGLRNVKMVAAGDFTSVALTHNGSVYIWGDNSNNSFGVPKTINNTPIQLKGLDNIIEIFSGRKHLFMRSSSSNLCFY
ncbi:hypothetical protein P9112_012536 [Eukaryota sp. TZLM1-RC]